MTSEHDFIIFGPGNHNSIGVLHCMVEAGHSPQLLIVGNPANYKTGDIIGYSAHAKKIHTVNSIEEGIEWLKSFKQSLTSPAVIYPTGDEVVKCLNRNKDELKDSFIFPTSTRPDGLEGLLEKSLQESLAEEAGLLTLHSQKIDASFSKNEVPLPCMVKPLDSTTASKGDMRVCRTIEELNSALASGKDLIIQPYLEKDGELLLLGICVNGNIWIPASVSKNDSGAFGEYTHTHIEIGATDRFPYISQVKKFVASLNYNGPFAIEFGISKGKPYFFEINLRSDATGYHPLSGGINIPFEYYKACRTQDYQFPTVNTRKEFDMVDEIIDIRRVFNHEISLLEWVRFFKNAKSYRYYHPSDKKLIPILARMFIMRTSDKLLRALKK